jgi:hypothetical protein
MAGKARMLTSLTVFLVSLGLVATYEINHHSEENLKVVECPSNATLPGGLPLPAGVPCPTETSTSEPTESEPLPTYPPVPPASKAVSLNVGYSGQGWAVVPGSLTIVDGLVYSATISVLNEHSTARPASFDIYLYTNGTMAADMAPPTGNTVKPGVATRLYLYYIYGDDNLNVDRLADLPRLTYVLIADKSVS